MTTARCLYKVHIADGFVDDCDELVHHCSKLKTLTYDSFCEIWKNLNFASIYRGRALSAEIAELSEEVIHIAKQYLVANTSNFEESVAGLFLVYGLLNLQPFQGFACLRLVPEDMPAINRIELVARRERRLEVLYILGAVLIRGPCQFHASPREHGMESSYRKYVEGFASLDKQGIRPKGVFYRQNEELDIIRELNNLTRLYTDAKAQIDDGKESDRNLNYVNKTLPAELDSSLKKIINGLIEDNDSDGEEDSHRSVQALKERAMKNVVNPVKHLTGLRDKSRPKITSPKKTLDLTSPTGKVKSGSPRKPLTTTISGKRTLISNRKKTNAKYKRKKKDYVESSSDSEGELSIDLGDRDDEIIEEPDQPVRTVSPASSTYSECDPITLDPPNNHIEIEVNDDETQIEVDMIPVVIHKDKSQMVEIEIVDHYNKNGETESPEDLIRKLTDITMTKISGSSENTAQDSEQVFKIPHLLKKTEKKKLKKTVSDIQKSKFKKMGILPVANVFKDKTKKRRNRNEKN